MTKKYGNTQTQFRAKEQQIEHYMSEGSPQAEKSFLI